MHAFAAALLDALAQRRPVPRDAAAIPQGRAEVETIQAELIGALGGAGAWKVSPWSEDEAAMLAAPIPQAWVHRSGDTIVDAGALLLEVEFALVLAEDRSFRIAPAFELVRSRLEPGADWPIAAKSADLLATAGLVLGASVPLPPAGVCDIQLLTDAGPQSATTALSPELLLRAGSWAMAYAERMGLPMPAGTAILTGARLGPLPVGPGRITAALAGVGTVAFRLGN